MPPLTGASGGQRRGNGPLVGAKTNAPATEKSDRQATEDALAGQIVRQLSSASKKSKESGAKALKESGGLLSKATREKYGLPAVEKKNKSILGKALGVTKAVGRATGLSDLVGDALRTISAPGQAVLQAGRRGAEARANGFQLSDLADPVRGFGAGLKTAVDPNAETLSFTEAVEGRGAKFEGAGGWAKELVGGAITDPTTFLSFGTSSAAKGGLKAVAKAGEEKALKELTEAGAKTVGKAAIKKGATKAERAAAEAAAEATVRAEARKAGRSLAEQVRREGITEGNRATVRQTLKEAAEDRIAAGEKVLGNKGNLEKTLDRQMKVIERGAQGGVGFNFPGISGKTGALASKTRIPGLDRTVKGALAVKAANQLSKTAEGQRVVSALRKIADSVSTKAGNRRSFGDAFADAIGQEHAIGRGVVESETTDALKALTKARKTLGNFGPDEIRQMANAFQTGTIHTLPEKLRDAALVAQRVLGRASGLTDEAEMAAQTSLPGMLTERAERWLHSAGLEPADARSIMQKGSPTDIARGTTAPTTLAGKEAALRSALEEADVFVPEGVQLIHHNPLAIAAESARIGGEQHAVQSVIDGLQNLYLDNGIPLVSKIPQEGYHKMGVTINNVTQEIYAPPSVRKGINQLSRFMSDDRAVAGVVRHYDQVNNIFKGMATVPIFAPLFQGAHFLGLGFHMRNMQGNILLNAIKGVNPADYSRALMFQIHKARGESYMTAADKAYDAAMKSMNTIGTDAGLVEVVGRTERGIMGGLGTRGKVRGGAGAVGYALSPTKGGAAVDVGRKLGTVIEDNAKIAHFMHMSDRGLSPHDAAMSVKETLFDYQDLTEFERRVLKRTVPFYTFMRKNTPLQLSEMAKHPGYILNQQRAENALTRDPNSDEAIPEYARRDGQRILSPFGKSIIGAKGADPVTFQWDTPFNAMQNTLRPWVQMAALIPGAPGDPPTDVKTALRDMANVPGGGYIGMGKAIVEIITGDSLLTGGKAMIEDGKELDHIIDALFPTGRKISTSEQDSVLEKLTGLKGKTQAEKQQLGEIRRRIEVLKKISKDLGVETIQELREQAKAPRLATDTKPSVFRKKGEKSGGSGLRRTR